MRSPHQIQEDIDRITAQRDRDMVEAKQIYEKAKSEDRQLLEQEARRFDFVAGRAKEAKQWLSDLREELEKSNNHRGMIVMASTHPSSVIYNASAHVPGKVLPTNGVLPGDEQVPQPFVRTSKLKCFANEREAYDAGMYLRSIVARLYNRGEDSQAVAHCERRGWGMHISNSAYEGSGSAGGYLVPPQVSQRIIDTRENVGIARRVCSIQPMTGDSMSIPKRTSGLTVYYPNELQTITDSDKSWQLISLAAEKRAVASKISQELVDDALISIVDNVFQEMAYALALREDQELISGDASSSYGHVNGLKNAIGSAGIYTCDANENLWSEIDLEDVMLTMAKLPDRFNRNPVWICSSNFYYAVFARLLGAAGGAGLNELRAGDGGEFSFFGRRVLTTSAMPTADADAAIHALFGQFDMAVILGDRTGIRIGRDDSVGFLNDYTTLKATSRYDIKVHEPGDSSNAGAYVALKTNSA